MKAPTQAVGVLGGSFDPVHNGHIAIAESFITSNYISELWVLLTPESPFKSKQPKAVDYELRFKMLSLAFNDQPNIMVSDVEQQLPPPYYTVQTLRFLTNRHPQKAFYLCMGSDSLVHFHQWHQWEELLQYCDLLVACRPSEYPTDLDPKIAEKSQYIPNEPINISSTEIRKKIHEGEDIAGLVPPPVEEIISLSNLYKY